MALTVYQQANVGEPSFYIGDAGPEIGPFAAVRLDGHDLRMQTVSPDDLDALAAVLTEAAAALRETRRDGGA